MNLIDINREKIDKIDDEILRLLNERASAVIAIGKIKKELGKPIWVPSREAAIYERLSRNNKDGIFPTTAIKPIFREIISASAALEDVIKVAYFGPAGTFTHLAGVRHFGLSAKLIPLSNIEDIFIGVEKDRFTYGIVPIENSLEGVVTHSIDMFIDSSVTIVGEIYMEIKHNLLNLTGEIADIKSIHSHPQALAQCRNYISKTFKDIQIYESDSTAEAAKEASKDIHIGAIGSEVCEILYNLKVVERSIQDASSNYTRFIILGKDKQVRTGNDRTSLMFSINHTAGALYKALEVFEKHGINMTKIESRPSKQKVWEYFFYVNIDGHIEDEKVIKALDKFKKSVTVLKVLGSYPKSEGK